LVCDQIQFSRDLADAAAFLQCLHPPEPLYRTILAFVTPTLVATSAIIALRALYNTRRLARQKATLDLIEKTESTEHYRAISSTFSRLRRSDRLRSIENPKTDEDKRDRQDVLDFLNHYELVAIGIREGILDGKIYQAWMLSAFIRDWNAAADIIQAERWRLNQNGTDWIYHAKVFASYGWLACKWSRSARLLVEEGKPAMPAAPPANIAASDDPLPMTAPVALGNKGGNVSPDRPT